MSQPFVAVSTDIRHFENYTWHAAPHQYLQALLSQAGALPVLIPSFGDKIDFDALLSQVDGVMLTGSKSNVQPSLYGGENSEANGPYDEARDATTMPLIRRAIELGVPLLAICRGIQELNVALGGSLASEIQEIEGRWDHRAPESPDQDARFAIRQTVKIAPGSCLAAALGAGDVQVNSVHRQAVDRLAPKLQVEAVAEDGTVEAVSVVGSAAFAVGVQWHPEYWASTDAPSARIFQALGPDGVFINIGRGSTVDEDALATALKDGTIRAAGLDVFANEPNVSSEFLALDNMSLLPHVGSATVQTRVAMADLVVDNLIAWFDKHQALTPVPETVNITRKRG